MSQRERIVEDRRAWAPGRWVAACVGPSPPQPLPTPACDASSRRAPLTSGLRLAGCTTLQTAAAWPAFQGGEGHVGSRGHGPRF